MPTAWEREQARLEKLEALAVGEADADERNAKLEEILAALERVLRAGTTRDDLAPNYESRKLRIPDRYEVGAMPRPQWQDFEARETSQLGRMVPGWKQRYGQRIAYAKDAYARACQEWQIAEDRRIAQNDANSQLHANQVRDAEAQHRRVDELAADARRGRQYAVEDYVIDALSSGWYPDRVSPRFHVRYLPSRRTLLLECEFPLATDCVPAEGSWRYNKSAGAVQAKQRVKTDVARIYKEVLAQCTLRGIYEALSSDVFEHIDVVAFNGVVAHVDPTNGRPTRSRLISLRTERGDFLDRDFNLLDPVRTVKSLHANFSNSPLELTPILPIVEFDVSDPRLIEEQDILSTLNDGMNLLDLTPSAFEHVVTNLFTRMGFDAYPTQRSKDGGIDCIAYYKESVLSGKYSIQAKQWTIPVQVSAVRDLYGAMQHERANTGILVTTSRFTPACYKFVEGKPMQLIDGSGLLALFVEHTDLKVRIVFPRKGAE